MGSGANRRRRTLAVLALVSGLVLLASVWLTPTEAHFNARLAEIARTAVRPLGGPTQVNATMNTTDAPAFSPNTLAVPNGAKLSLHVQNTGEFNHSFTLLAHFGVLIPRNFTPQQVYAAVAANGTLANVSLAPGASAWVNLTLNTTFTPGVVVHAYQFLSIVPFQFQAGMSGLLNVTATIPTGPPQVLFLNGTDSLTWVPDVLGVENVSLPVKVDVGVSRLGSVTHTWTLDPVPNNTQMNPGNFEEYLAANPPPSGANVTVSAPVGTLVWANFTLTKQGVYTFICEVPGHYANGMNGSLYINIPIPHVVAPSSAIVLPGVLAVGLGLVGVGVVLVVGLAYQGRFRPPPPEPRVP